MMSMDSSVWHADNIEYQRRGGLRAGHSAELAMADRNEMTMDDDGAANSEYNRKIGARLRDIRRQKRMTLQDVEADSALEFKASVLGAYERGERAISVPRLERLARFYLVPIDQLFPRESVVEVRSLEVDPTALVIDLVKLSALTIGPAQKLQRFFRLIELERHDYNGRMMTIRGDDRRALAIILDVPVDDVWDALDKLDLLHRSSRPDA
jgi:transcriptional regulator with XRE-family HTH domain